MKISIKGLIDKLIDRVRSNFSDVDYPVNDPAVPLVIHQHIPDLPDPCPPFAVQGFNGAAGDLHSLQRQAAGVWTMIVGSLAFMQPKASQPLTRWSRTNQLIVFPRAGSMFNAYYDGNSLRFFYGTHPITSNVVFTCESSDIVTHELGHAILDSYRPDLWNVQALEIHAFHESFGDMNAILSALAHDEVIDFIINETQGDLHKSNIVSRLAEEMGNAIYAQMHRQADCLRNAVNNFNYVPPESLPMNGDIDALTAEPHSFSRVFTGAFYDILVTQYVKNCKLHNPHESLAMARDQLATILYKSIAICNNCVRFYDAMVHAFQIIDKNEGGQCHDSILEVFTNRNMFVSVPLPMAAVAMKLDGKDTKVFKHSHGSTVRIGGVRTICLAEETVLAQSDNPLYSVDVETPQEHYVEYDGNGRLKLEKPFDKADMLRAVKFTLDYLHATDKVSYGIEPEPTKEFSVVDNKLIRNFICGGH